jgi:hypothetical protein
VAEPFVPPRIDDPASGAVEIVVPAELVIRDATEPLR